MDRHQLLRAVNAELTFDELNQVVRSLQHSDTEHEDSYYLPEVFIDVCMKRLNNEIDAKYFDLWVVTVALLLLDEKEHYDLGDFLDGASFDDLEDTTPCKKIIAKIREYDARFHHPDIVEYHRQKKLKVVYKRFEFCDGEEALYKCYIVDHANKKYDVRIVDGTMIDYDLSKTYCEMVDEEYSADIKSQEMDLKNYVIDCTKPQKQFCEVEDHLQSLFYENYKRDKTLEL